ncbi:unnamed protein product [Musa acuminata subsp. malaccensis]|uniref:(wild Malaysian banana) hypothetical protein n=1 Tax=Musa acuminata subsp. malaccensis TaxID=214687 RepID=A0A804JFE6_MUSAM|nr:PREDICTED: cyclic dof factor 1-like isoform X1 [Musa acuminata subsp. malaccensis]CAG1846026.1 unnamed protein product [Musa acuminata subsp. malaccensis]
MSENRDSPTAATIKLFGKTITLQQIMFVTQDHQKEEDEPRWQEKNETSSTWTSEIHKPAATAAHDDASTKKTTPLEQQPDDARSSRKKPDKILPCPRCKSLDTKFCYYNNYNVNQPRHFCKHCQRYWTAGGTMRNVPVGAGRRKSKKGAWHQRRLPEFESVLQTLHHPSLKPNGTVLSFGSDSAPRPAEKTTSCNKNGVRDNSGRPSEASPVPCFSRSPWPYPWTPPVPFYPAAACWSIPWLSPVACLPSAESSSPALDEHSREGHMVKNGSLQKEDSILVPRTMRIDDPEEAAKSCIWTMVGIKSSKNSAIGSGGLLGYFQPKGDIKNRAGEAASLLHANPAALSRSLNFQETS